MSLLNHLRTGPRLFAAFLLVFAFSSVATVVGLVGLGQQHAAAVQADHLRVLVEEMDKVNYYTSDIGAWEMGVGMDAFYLGPARAVAPDGPNRAGLLADVEATKAFLTSVHTQWMTAGEQADFAQLTLDMQGYLATADKQAEILTTGGPNAARALAAWLNDGTNGQLAAYGKLSTSSTKMVDEVQQRAAQTAADAASSAATYRTATLATIGAALLAALVLARVVQLSVTRPLAQCVEALRALGRKDLSVRLHLRSRDEMGDMARALDDAAGAMQEAVTDMGGSVKTLTAASGGLSQVAHRLSTSAAQVAEHAQGSAAAAAEVSVNVQTTASGAEEMGASIREISVNAQQAAEVAASAVETARATSATVARLGDSSTQIGSVLKVITGIAEQTNLLALNATIEAARAGDAGKGFAVVAGEVKELAQETARATEDIGRRVEAIQVDTGQAIDAIGSISAIIDRINDFQSAIATAVEEQTATTQEMSRSVAEVASGSSSISARVDGLAHAADVAGAEAAHTERASSELASLADHLQTLVAQFTA